MKNENGVASFLAENIELLPRGRALDLAMGNGRNTVYLAQMGFTVEGIDISAERIGNALTLADKMGVEIDARVVDLEDGYRIEENKYDVIICINYLHRPLIAQIKAGLKRGGVAVYETYLIDQRQWGKPSNQQHLLQHNELLDMFCDLRCLRYREGIIKPKYAIAGIIAEKV
jgi:2-polyprenyl-3-methyl-5-hydroxy-6-metoxy-1,4-benzoquinol methylase